MAASSSFHDSLFSMNTLLHMITIKLSSTNYLLWRNHMIPIFTYQKLIGHINGTSISPSPKVTIEGKANPNPDLLTWTEDDQRAVILLQSSLTEEAAAEVLGLTTAHQIWLSLEAAYSNASVERIHLLRDSLRQLKKSLHGTPTPPAVFHVETTNTDSAQGGGRSNRGNHSRPPPPPPRGRGRGHNRRPPHCQLCLTNGHYATTCPSLYTYATQASPSSDESLAKAFHAQCHVNTNTPNWHVDSGATNHMTPACDSLHHSSPYPGNAKKSLLGKMFPITSSLPLKQKHAQTPTNLGLLHHVLMQSFDPIQECSGPHNNPITSQHSLGVQDIISVHHSDQVYIPANDSDLVHVSDPENHPLATHIAPDQPTTGSSTSSYPMTTRSKAGIFKHKYHADLASLTTHLLHVALLSTTEPRRFKTAAKDPKWMKAMNEEFQALQQNQTWVLVPRPGSANFIGSKWVYRIKYNSDGTIERYKARLVAQGCSQIPGLDYYHTFSPVVKASTVRIVISLAVLHKWKLHQLDVKNAFLNGHLNETVFMEQPPGFLNHQYPNHVCKLSRH
ncbi:zinc finger, CCHC-type containing LTR copia-type gag-polypeptide [Tanacetum coccineum]|uniref:Zinc finger, CCHC-type containing LTR copia-type gag-polypeptide n=1 Tax=Tanacetum coccineum TaxID=301880 RepID=A0ABQ4YA05_9ASTR